MDEAEKLDFAYRYPFSSEAKELIASMNVNSVDDRYLTSGLLRLNEALGKSKIEFFKTNLTQLKYTYLMSYAYARMLVSAVAERYAVLTYVAAEAKRCSDALADDSAGSFERLSGELRFEFKEKDGEFLIGLEGFLKAGRKEEDLRLVNQHLEKGVVHLEKSQAIKLLGAAIAKEIGERLPLEKRSLPKEVIDAAKGVKLPERRLALDLKGGAYAWIEKLLATPIVDVRHRSVNLILAPYFTNVRGLDEEEATKAVMEYIERCKAVNPNTKINEAYIRYQCKYAKSRGLKPLSLVKARELLADVIEFR